MLKKIKKLDVDADAVIELVEDAFGRQLILKTCESETVILEKHFVDELRKHGLPHLEVYSDDSLTSDQILLEYVPESRTLTITPELPLFVKWGSLVRQMHTIHAPRPILILEDGASQEMSWRAFLSQKFDKHRLRHLEKGTLGESDIKKVEAVVHKLAHIERTEFSLLHGDLHRNNVLIRDSELVLFDKGHRMLYGDPHYDLATVVAKFQNSAYHEFIESFLKGYGEDVFMTRPEEIKMNIILRCFERHPNRHGKAYTGDVLRSLLG